jgi:hypothetical protein
MDINQINEMRQASHANLRHTFLAILTGRVYRNAGELDEYEVPIAQLMATLNWRNLELARRDILTSVIMAIFDGQDYPGRGTMPAIEQPIIHTVNELGNACEMFVNRAIARYANP